MTGFNTKVTPEIEKLTQICKDHTTIDLVSVRKVRCKKRTARYKRKRRSCRTDPGIERAGCEGCGRERSSLRGKSVLPRLQYQGSDGRICAGQPLWI